MDRIKERMNHETHEKHEKIIIDTIYFVYFVTFVIKYRFKISFILYFYKPAQMRMLDEIITDIRALERETDGLLNEIIGGGNI
jgi:hypothetical protein